LEKLSQGRNFFFLMSTPTQLSAYANHEFKIIPTPTQLSAYANHKLKNRYYLAKVARRQTAWAKYWSRAYARTAWAKHHIYHESTLQQDERRFFYICLAYAAFSSSFSSFCSWFALFRITFLIVFNICIERILSELSFFLVYARHMRSVTLIFKSFSQLVISFARFSASMLSSFIDISLCSVDAAHMHRWGFDDQMWILLWPCLMLLTYASHRARSFSNPTSDLGCAGHMPILKFNPTPRIFSDPGSTFPTPRPAVTRPGSNTPS